MKNAQIGEVAYNKPAAESIPHPSDEALHIALARVKTAKAPRYLKALCNHFNRKVTASYDDNIGRVHFPFGDCTLQAEAETLVIHVSAASAMTLTRTKHVVADHLVRFGEKDELTVTWVDEVS